MHDAASPGQEHNRTEQLRLPFVGRDSELRILQEALDLALTGKRQIVLISGEPGIGKTHIVERFSALTNERQACVFWGNCYEWEGAPAYWPWLQAFRAWMRELDDTTLCVLLGPHATLLAQIVPEIHERVPDLPPLPDVEPESRRFRLLTTIADVVRAAVERHPLVFVLDDIHWADTSTLQLLLFLTQEIRDERLLLIATYRDVELIQGHPATAIVADLKRDTNCQQIMMHGLSRSESARLISLIADQDQPQSFIDAVYAETEGNPFFAVEIMRLMIDDRRRDSFVPGLDRMPVPVSVREAVNRRLARLSPVCKWVLDVAAVIGRDFEMNIIEQVVDLSTMDVFDALDEAMRAQFIGTGKIHGYYRFSHALVQEALFQGMSSTKRAQLHLAIGQSFETEMGHDSTGDRAAARDLVERAIEEAETIGMHGLMPRATALRDRLAPASEYPDKLNPARSRGVANDRGW